MTGHPEHDLLAAARYALQQAVAPDSELAEHGDVESLTWSEDDGEWVIEFVPSALVDWLHNQRLVPGTRAWREHWSDVHIVGMEMKAYYGVGGSPYRYEPGSDLLPRPGAVPEDDLDGDGEWFAFPPDRE